MLFQEIAIIIIGVLTAGCAGWKIYRFFSRPDKTSDPCAGCPGCALKDEMRNRSRQAPGCK